MPIDPSVYQGIDTQYGLKLADLLNPASIRQRQRAEEEQVMGNQLRQMQLIQGVEQMRRAPVLAQREEQQWQAQQADAMRKQQEQARRQAMIAQLPEDQRRMLDMGVSPKDVLMPEQPKPSDLLARERFEWEKRQKPAGGGAGKLKFSESQGGFIEPPSAQFPQGRIIPVPGIKPKQQSMTPTAQKELFDTEEHIQGGEQALTFIGQAKELNKKAMGFTGSGALASMGTILPDVVRPEAVDATQELTNIVQNTALPQLKAIFGGMPTEGERKILLEMQGSVSQPAKVRERIFRRAEEATRRRLEFNKQKAARLREGSYFSGEGISQTADIEWSDL